MLQKVTDPLKIVTDGLVLERLVKQGIDKNYVEFSGDYSKEFPSNKFYRDLKSNKRFMVASGLPMVRPDGTKVEVGWIKRGNSYTSKANLFSAVVKNGEVTLILRGDKVTYRPQLYLDGIEQTPTNSVATLLAIDPVNADYHQNVLEWDYGVCKRRIRIIEGIYSELWITYHKGKHEIAHNTRGNLSLKFGSCVRADGETVRVQVIGDMEIVDTSDFPDSAFPVEIGATLTAYSTASDGYVDKAHATYATAHDAAVGDAKDDTSTTSEAFNKDRGADYKIRRGFEYFPTSGLGPTANISATDLSLYGQNSVEQDANHANLGIFEGVQDDPLVLNDYGDHLSKTTLGAADYYEQGTWNTGAYNVKALNATGIGWINKTGTTKFCLRVQGDVENNTPAGNNYTAWYTQEQGGGFRPKLFITYTTVAAPTVTTQAVTDIAQNTATGNGNITDTGGENPHTRGICWNTAGTPTTADSKAEDNGAGSYGTGAFSKGMTGLSERQLYYVRAYAINSLGTSYGGQVSFTTIFSQIVGAGSIVITGVLGLLTKLAVGAGSVSIAGVLGRLTKISVGVGSISMSGALTAALTFFQSVGAGAVSIVGTLGRKIFISLSGSVAIAGSLATIKTVFQTVGEGSVAISGALSSALKFFQSVGDGAVVITGVLGRKILLSVGFGSIAIAGSLSSAIAFSQSVGNGAVAMSSTLGRKIKITVGGGSVAIAGLLSYTVKRLRNIVTFTGRSISDMVYRDLKDDNDEFRKLS